MPDVEDPFQAERPMCGTVQSLPKRDQHLLIQSALSIAIVEHADDAIIVKTLEGTVLTWNVGAGRVFGYTAAEMIGGPTTR